jgi:hypothetical protein
MLDAQRVEHTLGIRHRLLCHHIADTGGKKLNCNGHADIIGHATAAV